MRRKPPSGLFITGTNTAVGKTFYATALARTLVASGKKVGVYKPAVSGCLSERIRFADRSKPPGLAELEQADDDIRLWWSAGCPGALSDVSPQRFQAPLAPHLAAKHEGRRVDPQRLRSGLDVWRTSSDFLLIEGAGGLFSPITDTELNADLAIDLGFPLLLVTANKLGVIHATLSTLLAARHYRGGLRVAMVVLNDLPDAGHDLSRELNFSELERYCAPTPVIRHRVGEQQASAEIFSSTSEG